jgi:hypothetical protein
MGDASRYGGGVSAWCGGGLPGQDVGGVSVTFLERRLGGHISIGPITFFGYNAMMGAVNIRGTRWGYVCFRPTVYMFGRWHSWYFYVSPNATPWAATFAIGPGLSSAEKLGVNTDEFI